MFSSIYNVSVIFLFLGSSVCLMSCLSVDRVVAVLVLKLYDHS